MIELSYMKFQGTNGLQSQFSIKFQEITINTYPFTDILLQRDLSLIKYADAEEIPFDSIFQLKVNVKRVGSVLFFFKKDNFDKDSFVKEVGQLAEIESSTMGDAIYKTKRLYEIAITFNPLFSIYCPLGDYVLYPDCFENLTLGIQTFYLYDYNPEALQAKKDRKNYKNEDKKPAKVAQNSEKLGKTPKEKGKTRNPFVVLKEDKFHYIFGLIAAFLIGFTIAISIFDMFLGKKIYIFFLVCALTGGVLNCLIYKDTLVQNKFKSMEMLLNVIVSLIGFGVSVGGYFLFKFLAKDKPEVEPNLFMMLGIGLGAIILTAIVGYLISLIIKRKRA